MDRARFLSHVVVFFIFALTACGPQAAVPTQVPVEPPATAVPAPVETAVPTEAVPVVATSPPMEVGSTFQYFDGSVLVAVPGGPFIMGAGGQDNPIRTVNVSDFWIYQVEVTNRMYGLCVTMGVCSLPDSTDNPLFGNVAEENKPVVGVDWGQASAYCGFVNGRLPTEAEWEKTARGPDGNKFPWGNQEPTCNLLNFDACMRKTTYVGTYPDGQSYYKAMDMSGNVFEWVQDWYLANYYGSAPTQDPSGPISGNNRSVRSSAYNTDGYLTEAARRFYAEPLDHRADLGFRCVVEDPMYFAPFCNQLVVYGKRAPIGQGTGQVVNIKCNEPSVTQGLDCKGTAITVDPASGPFTIAEVDPAHCTKLGSEMKWWCTSGGGSIKVCGDCEKPNLNEASCAPGFHQDGKLCVIDHGRPGRCPAGSIYDETLMCCTPVTGPGSSYRICAAWASYYPGATEDDPGYCFVGNYPGRRCWTGVVEFKEGCGQPNQPDCEQDPTLPGCGPGCVPGTPGYPYCNNSTTGCLAGGSLIDTPHGLVKVEDLRVGDSVWTTDASGARSSATVLKTSRVAVSASHQMVHLLMADGRELWASPGHPTADGQTLGDLKAGEPLDGSYVTLAERVLYGQAATYDLLPSGATGQYWVNGILLGSTLLDR
jgi:sulfatase modifying factor 1